MPLLPETALLINSAGDTEPLLWRVSKEKRGQQFPKALGVAPVNILLLHA